MQPGEIYIPDLNPFHLAPPPLWWQQALWAFDPDLRILPGRKKPVFYLARVRTYSRGLSIPLDDDQGDTAMFVRYDLVSVTWIASTDGWTQGFLVYILGELSDRDTWAVEGGPLTDDLMRKALCEGGSKFSKRLDQRDEDAEQTINREVRDDVYHATGDAWRSLQARTGERILNAARPSELPAEDALPTEGMKS